MNSNVKMLAIPTHWSKSKFEQEKPKEKSKIAAVATKARSLDRACYHSSIAVVAVSAFVALAYQTRWSHAKNLYPYPYRPWFVALSHSLAHTHTSNSLDRTQGFKQ